MKPLDSLLKIAKLHAKRLKYATDHLSDKSPWTAEDIKNLSEDELPMYELYTSRFSKLQDFIGSALFPAILEIEGESIQEMTFIDRLNKLEKLNLITSRQDWLDMRQLRNSLSHEYPENPELTAKFLNRAFSMGKILLDSLEKLENFTQRKK